MTISGFGLALSYIMFEPYTMYRVSCALLNCQEI